MIVGLFSGSGGSYKICAFDGDIAVMWNWVEGEIWKGWIFGGF